MKFSGSYKQNDVEFLLKKIDIDFTDIHQKEQKIQSGKKHYSEMISQEYKPTKQYLDIFYKAFNLNKNRFAKDILNLGTFLNKIDNLVIVSLARAGTPIGVLLKRTLENRFNRDVPHYSISIIRDRGIDENALKYILQKNPNANIVFIDGWTGKGVISRELKKYVTLFNEKYKQNISNKLYVLADIASKADFCSTYDDYLIPSSALNSTISGLVSRTILNDEFIKENDFHGCKFYTEYKNDDLSLWFIDEMMKIINKIDKIKDYNILGKNRDIEKKLDNYLKSIQEKYNIRNINHIKPGIGETTRVLLRRVPHLIIVKNIDLEDIQHLIVLAKDKNVKIIEDRELPYLALGLIKEI